MPAVLTSDEELGLGELLRIMPDTWNNISWVVQNSTEALVKQAIAQRRMSEEVKEYAMKSNLSNLDSVVALNENLDAGLAKCTKELQQAEDKLALKLRE